MRDNVLVHRVIEILNQQKFSVLETLDMASRQASLTPPPPGLAQDVKLLLNKTFPDGIYSHQTIAIQAALDDNDVCLATPTASGKSLAFMSIAAHTLKNDPQAKVLALYPAKALIQDQLTKWRSFLGQLGLELGYIDGGVLTTERSGILKRSHVVLMTPDVAHAWLLSKISEVEPRKFLNRLRLLILDEAHVYDGVFGTNMAHFIRRLCAVSDLRQVVSSTATIGEPNGFIYKLTGREAFVLTDEQDGSANPGKTLLIVRPTEGRDFDNFVRLISALAEADPGRFLAFADSRKMVEKLVAAASRHTNMKAQELELNTIDHSANQEEDESEPDPDLHYKILPYRAGYEEEDRRAIQRSLEEGELAGVVSTSALELGIDLGDLRIVLLLGIPPSTKAFRQRIGRVGRKTHGLCILIDDRDLLTRNPKSIEQFLHGEAETSRLYLENRYIQFANALCAAAELEIIGATEERLKAFDTLPPDFGRWLRNELSPTETIPEDLYPLKQRAQGGPHIEFPIRSGIEKSFSVKRLGGPDTQSLGSLSFSQSLREAYPGAVYYYMAQPFRVSQYRFRDGEIRVKRTKHYTTEPDLSTMVFPKFGSGILSAKISDKGFLAEAELQVSERVTGFYEKRGPNKIHFQYGPTSPYYQKALNRFFETTGVCWFFRNRQLVSEPVATAVLQTFCSLCGVQERDLGLGTFHSKVSPLGPGAVQGICIYDATHGSLRLTQTLADRFVEVIDAALLIAKNGQASALTRELEELYKVTAELSLVTIASSAGLSRSLGIDGDWATVIAPNERVHHRASDGSIEEVEVKGARYTPHGLMYELVPKVPNTVWMVRSTDLLPMHGLTKFARLNLVTGEQAPETEDGYE